MNPKKITFFRALPFLTLGLELFCVVLGTILFLAYGLDQYDQFFKPPFAVCPLPYSLAFPAFILLELLGSFLSPEGYSLCPMLKPNRTRTYVSAVATGLGTLLGLLLFFTQLSSNPVFAGASLSFLSLIGLFTYIAFGFYEGMENPRSNAFLAMGAYGMAAVALAAGGFALSLVLQPTYVMLFAGLGLIVVCMTMLGRKED